MLQGVTLQGISLQGIELQGTRESAVEMIAVTLPSGETVQLHR